ncbi:MAG TPA: hypothetical protein VG890_15520 [Puia sp.]|nr:hypothetical protein [Puia sp.]
MQIIKNEAISKKWQAQINYMEVASIFSSERGLANLFYKFANAYDKLSLSSIDDDTAYFENIKDGRNEIYLHYKLNDIDNEFGYNYAAEQAEYVKEYFKGFPVFLFDISFRDISFFNTLLTEFVFFLKNQKDIAINKMLLSDPFDGLKPIW